MKRGHAPTRPRRPTGTFRREGEYWTIGYSGLVVRLRDTKGLQYIAHLLRHPGQAFYVGELARLPSGGSAAPASACKDDGAERTRKAVTNRIRQAVVRIGATHRTLGIHLGNAVHTGGRCVYTPERPTRWGV